MRRSRWTAVALAVAAVLVGGCATTIAGSAEPNPAGLSAAQSTTSASFTPSSTSSSVTDTSGAEGSETSPASTSTESGSSTSGSPSSSATPESTGSSTDSSTSASSSTGSSAAYPTTPLQYNRTPSTKSSANLLEARRIASALPVPTFIDPAYTRSSVYSTLPLRGPSAMSSLFVDPVPSVAQRAGMITGFSSARRSTDATLLVAAFEFGTAAQATAAVPALAAASVYKEFDKGKAKVPGYPAAAGLYGSTTDGAYLQSFLAQGRMVLYVYLSGKKQTTAQQSALAATTFKAQSAAFAAFKPTAPTALMQLLVDPEGMLAHTVPNTAKESTVMDGYMTAAGQLHYDSDPVGTRALFASAGVDAVGGGRTTLYRARNGDGAAAVRDNFVAGTQKANSMQPYLLSSAAPGAKCLQAALDSKYYCVGVRGRYAFELSADSEGDINAAMSAQYQLLAGF